MSTNNPEQMPETIFAARLNSVDVCGGEKFQYWSEKGDAISTSYTLTSTVNQLRSERDGAVRDLRVAVSTVNSLMAERDALKKQVGAFGKYIHSNHKLRKVTIHNKECELGDNWKDCPACKSLFT